MYGTRPVCSYLSLKHILHLVGKNLKVHVFVCIIYRMADWGAWKNSSPGGNDLLSLYSNCSQVSPSLYNNLCVNGSFTPSPSKLEGKMTFCDKDSIDQCASMLNQVSGRRTLVLQPFQPTVESIF